MIDRKRWWRWGLGGAVVLALAVVFSARYPAERLEYTELRSTRVVDREGRLLFELRGGRGTYQRPVALDQISPWVVWATLAGEDANFRHHAGVDPVAIARALWLNAAAGRFAFGGSTITQQLAKNLRRQPRNLPGKLSEAWDAWRLERTLGKDAILAQYLNRADYGHAATGIEAAAQRYFGKYARDLTLDEAALLAVLPRAPSAYNPTRHPERALARRAHVLGLMVERGYLDAASARAAAAAPLRLHEPSTPLRARHVLDRVTSRKLVRRGVGEVALTIDVELTEAIERRIRAHLELLADSGAEQAAVVVLEVATGDVLAMVGSRRYGEPGVAGAVNATTALRAPGSTLKPFVYALALEDGAHPSVPVLDVPTHFLGYQPRALRDRHLGAVALRDALGSSLNVPAVRTAAAVGIPRLATLLHDAGLEHLDPTAQYGLSLALGGASVQLVELTNAYATLARGGEFRPWRLVADSPRAAPLRVLKRETAFLVTDALADPMARRLEFGLETPLDLPFPVAAKTGTSQAFTDNVALGYTPQLVVGVWVGRFDGTPLRGLLAMRGAAPLLREALLRAARGRERRDFTPPPGVERSLVCRDGASPASSACAAHRREWVPRRVASDPERAATPTCPAASGVACDVGRGARASAPLAIEAPPAGSRFVIDPLLARERQRVALRARSAEGAPRRVRWLVDGRLVAEAATGETGHWTLTPGRHLLRVEDVDDEAASDEIEFGVEG